MISLLVRVIDEDNINKSFESKNSDMLYIPILVHDLIKDIREKIFLIDKNYEPNFLKLWIKDENNENIIINQDNVPLFTYYKVIPKNPIIYIKRVENYLLQNFNKEKNKENNELYSYFMNESKISILLEDIKKLDYIKLTEKDLKYAIFLLLDKYHFGGFSPDQIKNVIRDHNQEKDRNLQSLKRNYYDYSESSKEFYKLFEYASKVDENLITNINFSDIDLIIKGKNIPEKNFIKLQSIFNYLPLDKNIPFIALSKKSISENVENSPLIKIYDKINISEKDIKSWILNERKVYGIDTKTKKEIYRVIQSYKIVKGVLIKLKSTYFEDTYLTVNIFPNGIIKVNINFKESKIKVDEIIDNKFIDLIQNDIDNLINKLNTMNIFIKSYKLDTCDNSIIKIDSFDVQGDVQKFLNKTNFINLLINIENLSILKYKPTTSIDIISGNYTKLITPGDTQLAESEQNSISGITINILRTEYEENESTTVKMFGAESLNQIKLILLITTMLLEYVGRGGEQVISKEKVSKIMTKEKEYSVRCQRKKQPIIVTDESEKPIVKDSYILNYKNDKYLCKNNDYPYPGFTKTNVVCCFNKNQKGNENYIRNMDPDSLNIIVRPSNYPVKIIDKSSNKMIETYVISSDFYPEYPYYYISLENKLEPIEDSKIIQEINNLQKNIWLESVTLSKLLYPSSTSKCNKYPDLLNRTVELHDICKEHSPDNKYFAYEATSIPCCMVKEREKFSEKKHKKTDITKQYKIQLPNTVLIKDQIGVLPPFLENIFSSLNKIDNKLEDKFYRLGVIQNNYSFFSAVMSGVDNKIIKYESLQGGARNKKSGVTKKRSRISAKRPVKKIEEESYYKKFNNYIELIKYIKETVNHDIFKQLNKGDISLKYKTLENYIKFENEYINYIDYIDLLERIFSINIIILEKITGNEKDDSTEDIRIICRNKDFKDEYPSVLILKSKTVFELIIKIENDSNIIRNFKSNDSVIKFFRKFMDSSCIKQNKLPEIYPYIDLLDYKFVLNNFNVIYQISNIFNKVNLLITKEYFIIPINETGIIENVKEISMKEFLSSNNLLTLDQYIKYLDKYNKILVKKGQKECVIIGVMNATSLENEKYKNLGGLLTNYGMIVPYKLTSNESSLPKLEFKYYPLIDDLLYSNELVLNIKEDFIKNKNYNEKLKNDIYNIKVILGKIFTELPDIKVNIEKKIKENKSSKNEKMDYIITILNNLLTSRIDGIKLNYPLLEFILNHIVNEMINDNVENLLLNNIVTTGFDKNEVIIRDTESVLTNINDIRKWIEKYKNIEL